MTLGGLPKGGYLETITEANTFGLGHTCGYPQTLGWEVPPCQPATRKGVLFLPRRGGCNTSILETTSILSQIKGLAPQDQVVTVPMYRSTCVVTISSALLAFPDGSVRFPIPIPCLYLLSTSPLLLPYLPTLRPGMESVGILVGV